jgi:hypothetical protein
VRGLACCVRYRALRIITGPFLVAMITIQCRLSKCAALTECGALLWTTTPRSRSACQTRASMSQRSYHMFQEDARSVQGHPLARAVPSNAPRATFRRQRSLATMGTGRSLMLQLPEAAVARITQPVLLDRANAA